MNPVKVAVKAAVNTAIKTFTSSIFGRRGLRLIGRGARLAGKGFLGEKVLKLGGRLGVTRRGGVTVARALDPLVGKMFSKASRFVGDIPNYVKLLRSVRSLNANKISDKIINEFANKATVLRNQAIKSAFKKKTGKIIQKNLLMLLMKLQKKRSSKNN